MQVSIYIQISLDSTTMADPRGCGGAAGLAEGWPLSPDLREEDVEALGGGGEKVGGGEGKEWDGRGEGR